jgi:hypothetical protein
MKSTPTRCPLFFNSAVSQDVGAVHSVTVLFGRFWRPPTTRPRRNHRQFTFFFYLLYQQLTHFHNPVTPISYVTLAIEKAFLLASGFLNQIRSRTSGAQAPSQPTQSGSPLRRRIVSNQFGRPWAVFSMGRLRGESGSGQERTVQPREAVLPAQAQGTTSSEAPGPNHVRTSVNGSSSSRNGRSLSSQE